MISLKIKFTISIFTLFSIFSACSLNNPQPNSVIASQNNVETNIKDSEKILEPGFDHNFFSVIGCKSFLGSYNPPKCMNPPIITYSFNYGSSISNIIKFNDKHFVLSQDGKIYEHNFEEEIQKIFLDLSEKVQFSGLETGLLSMAFSPSHNDFLVSYVNKSGYLTFELYEYKAEDFKIINSTVIFQDIAKKKENYGTHYGGKIIWSDYFGDYLISLGDFHEGNALSRLNPDPLDNRSLKGKILLTNIHSNTKIENIYKMEESNQSNALQNVVTFGLRNPWQFFEVGSFLIIFDTGLSQNEELNKVNLEDGQINLGWPVFEGTSLSEDIDKIKNYKLDLEIEKGSLSWSEFVSKSSELPDFYYNHYPCDALNLFGAKKNCEGSSDHYKAAIIGGDILINSSSEYNFDIFFADYLSEELFSYNLTDASFNIYPIQGINQITSVNIFNHIEEKIMVTTTLGELIILQLNS